MLQVLHALFQLSEAENMNQRKNSKIFFYNKKVLTLVCLKNNKVKRPVVMLRLSGAFGGNLLGEASVCGMLPRWGSRCAAMKRI